MATIEMPQANSGNPESSLIRSRNSLSSTSKEDPKKTKPQLKGGVSKKELSFGEKVKRSFVKEDLRDIGDYIVFDVIIPGIQQGLYTAVVGTAAQIFHMPMPRIPFGNNVGVGYGGTSQRLTPHERQYRDYTSIQSNRPTTQSTLTPRYNTRFYATDYPFTYKEDADSVLEQLIDICDTYGWVSVANFFEFADPDGTITGTNPYTNNHFGWSNVDGATVKFDGSGYVITLPPARPRS